MSKKHNIIAIIIHLILAVSLSACYNNGCNKSTPGDLPLKTLIIPGRHKLTVKWKPVPRADACTLKYNSENSCKSSQTAVTIYSGKTYHEIKNLKSGTDYYIWLIAAGANGFYIQRGALKAKTKTEIKAFNSRIYLSDVPGDIIFPKGINDEKICGKNEETLSSFEIADTETTNEFAAEVFQWALDHNKFKNHTVNSASNDQLNTVNKYTVKLCGQELLNLDGRDKNTSCGIEFRSGHFRAVAGHEHYPCVFITWYGAVAFCNWLSEMVYGNSDENVYSWDSESNGTMWLADSTVMNKNKKGFRLPETMEWELAARYIYDFNGDRDILDKGEYYPGSHASGDETSYCFPDDKNKSQVYGNFGWYKDNSGNTLHIVGTSGSDSASANRPLPVSGKFCNALGLFDMSGNVWEMCFTKHGPYRVFRGGSWDNIAYYLHAGGWFFDYPETCSSNHGFRIVRSH